MGQMTPMLQQYVRIKGEHPDAILFFRMGDFYEMFFEDAEIAARILGITLTSRGTHNGRKVPMCGVPHHAAKSYVARLVDNGWKVAICEQVEDPKTSKGIVKRDVVRIVTPGSLVDEREVESRSNLFIAALSGGDGKYGLAHVDLTTGEFRVTEVLEWNHLLEELGRIDPAELLLPEDQCTSVGGGLSTYRQERLSQEKYDWRSAESLLLAQLGVKSLEVFGCRHMTQGVIAAGAVVAYLRHTQKVDLEHIREIVPYQLGDFMFLDEPTCSHLELLKTMRRHTVEGSLFQIIDRTLTPMGTRLLKRWIAYPLIHLQGIRNRLGAVACLKEDRGLREDIRAELKGIYDLERLNGRVALGRANARDLLALRSSILRLPNIKERFNSSTSTLLSDISARLDTLEDIGRLVAESIHEEPPVSVKEGGMIKEGYSEELDKLISLSREGKSWIATFAAEEQRRTGISNLKVGFNKVYGYYIEVSKANVRLVPPDYHRKQTLVNGERYITDSLKNMEERVLTAEERRVALEYEIFDGIRKRVALENQRIKESAASIATVDVLAGLAETADLNDYVCPEVDEDCVIEIREGRHPVIEQTVRDEEFVPNDVFLDGDAQQVLIITGPNMAGKSTVLRQTALITLMAQMGSFVPASMAKIGLVDRIFSRVGASDDLARGRSTFMVEMNETANILRNATHKSLVILDEIGRGTSTYDGLSIAWAVGEALHDRQGKGARTLFATHYHELTELAASKPRVKNFNIAVREWNDQIVFLRKLVPGGTSRSYGIQVARIAGLPEGVLRRAEEILGSLEKEEMQKVNSPGAGEAHQETKEGSVVQFNLFGTQDRILRDWILGLDILSMTPLEAMVELNKLRDYVSSQK